LFPIWGDDAGKAGKLLFARKEVFPLSPRPSHPFKKSGVLWWVGVFVCWKSGVLWWVFFLCLLEKRCAFSGMLFVCGIADDVAAKLKKLLLRGILLQGI
jgi:hypothetical protein